MKIYKAKCISGNGCIKVDDIVYCRYGTITNANKWKISRDLYGARNNRDHGLADRDVKRFKECFRIIGVVDEPT